MTMPQIPEFNNSLWIGGETVSEIHAFVAERLQQPAQIGDVTVYCFSNHGFEPSALLDAVQDLDDGTYVVPFEVSGTWGYMVQILPDVVADAPVLAYKSEEGEYHEFDSYRDRDDANAVRRDLESIVDYSQGGHP